MKVFQRACCGLIRIRLLGCRNLADFWSLLMMLLVELRAKSTATPIFRWKKKAMSSCSIGFPLETQPHRSCEMNKFDMVENLRPIDSATLVGYTPVYTVFRKKWGHTSINVCMHASIQTYIVYRYILLHIYIYIYICIYIYTYYTYIYTYIINMCNTHRLKHLVFVGTIHHVVIFL